MVRERLLGICEAVREGRAVKEASSDAFTKVDPVRKLVDRSLKM